MLNIGMSELLLFGIVSLLVLGPEKLPEAARFVGKWYGKIKRLISSVQNEIDQELRLSEFREEMQKEINRISELENRVQQRLNELQQQRLLQNSPTIQQAIKAPDYHYIVAHKRIPFTFQYQQKNTAQFSQQASYEASTQLKIAV